MIEHRTRAKLQADPRFVHYFSRAKADVAPWDVQFIRVCDPSWAQSSRYASTPSSRRISIPARRTERTRFGRSHRMPVSAGTCIPRVTPAPTS